MCDGIHLLHGQLKRRRIMLPMNPTFPINISTLTFAPQSVTSPTLISGLIVVRPWTRE